MNSNENEVGIVEVAEVNFNAEVLQSKRPVLVALLSPFHCLILWHENAAAQHRAATFSSGNQHLPSTLAEAKAPARVQQRRFCEPYGFGAHIRARGTLKLTASAKVPANFARH